MQLDNEQRQTARNLLQSVDGRYVYQMKNAKSKKSCNKVPAEIHDRAGQIASVLMKSKKPITNEWLKKEG